MTGPKPDWPAFVGALRDRVVSGAGLVLVDAAMNAHATTAVLEAVTLTGRRDDLVVLDLAMHSKAMGRRPRRATHFVDWDVLYREGHLGSIATAACEPRATWGIEASRRYVLPEYAEALWECRSMLGGNPRSAWIEGGEGNGLVAMEAALARRGMAGPALRRFRASVPSGDPAGERLSKRLAGVGLVMLSSPDAFEPGSGLVPFSLTQASRAGAVVLLVTSTDTSCTNFGLALAHAIAGFRSDGRDEGTPPFFHRPQSDAGLPGAVGLRHCVEDGLSPCARSPDAAYEALRERFDRGVPVERIGSDAVIRGPDAMVAVLIPDGSPRSATDGPVLIVRTGRHGWFSCAIATPYAGKIDHAFARLLAIAVAREALDPFGGSNGHAELPGLGSISFEAMKPSMAGMWQGPEPVYGDVRTGRMLDALVDPDLVSACATTPRASAIHAWATHDPSRRRNRSDFVRTWKALSMLGPEISEAIDSGLPGLPAVARCLGTTPSRARRLSGRKILPKSFRRSLVDIRSLDVNLLPARDDSGEWYAFVECLDHVTRLRNRLEGTALPEPEVFMRPMISLARTWRARSDALEGRSLADIADPQRSLMRLVDRTLAGRDVPGGWPDVIATTLVLGFPSYAHVLEMSDRWHDHPVIHEFSDAGRPPLPEGFSWPPLFAGEVREGDVFAKVLVTPAELRAEGLPGPDDSGIEGLSHCVSGYRWSCATGDSHIVAIRRDAPDGFARLSTLEIARSPGGPLRLGGASYRVNQHKSHRNRRPCEAALAMEARLVTSLAEGGIAVNPDALARRALPSESSAADDALEAFHGMWRPLLPRGLNRLDLDGFRAKLLAMPAAPMTVAA